MRPARLVAALAVVAAVVGCGGDDDDAGSAGGADEPVRPVVDEDHWHAAFGVYVCDAFLPDVPAFESADGIHTHGDGVIHIHPFTAAAAGESATLAVFLDGAGIEVTDDGLTVDGDAYGEGEEDCPGGEGQVRVLRWADAADAADSGAEPEQVDPDVHLQADGEGYVVAFVAEGTEVPAPESAAQLAELGAVDSVDAVPTTPPPADDAGDGAEDADDTTGTDERNLADGFYVVEATEPAPCRSPDMRPERATEICYLLPDAPAVETGAVESAEASIEPSTGGWQVELVFTEDGIAAFNEVAVACVQQGTTCPLGRLALLVDGEVVMAPQIMQPSFERDQIVVSGDFTRDEVESLADAIAG
jgi:hypothetical protein